MARRAKRRAEAHDEPARRAGRTPGTWNLTSPEALLEFRKSHKVSRARLASVLGVSQTSVQNWETGRVVATTPIQQKLAHIMSDGVALSAGAVRRGRGQSGPDDGAAAISTTALIVTGYLASLEAPISQDELVALIRSVRLALS